MARHGPHQVAQKSTSTGCSDFKTSCSKFVSFTSRIASLPITFLQFGRSVPHAMPAASPGSANREIPQPEPEPHILALPLDAKQRRRSQPEVSLSDLSVRVVGGWKRK